MVLGVDVNFVSVLIAAVASMIVGSLWYGPLFGKTWIKISGLNSQKIKSMKQGASKSYIIGFITSVVLAYVFATILRLANATDVSSAILVSFFVWLGFSATQAIGTVIWEGKSWTSFWLHGVGGLVSLIVQGIILTLI